jgi:hypothetical protein
MLQLDGLVAKNLYPRMTQMTRANKLRLVSGAVLGIALVLTALPARAQEVKFLKVKFSGAQEELGRAIQDAAQLRVHRGSAPEKGLAQERLGSAIAKSALIVFSEKTIDREVRKQFGKMSLAASRGYPISPEARQAEALRRAGRFQELLGAEIMRKVRLTRAEEDLNRAVQESLRSPRIPRSFSERFDENLSVLNEELGYGPENDLRLGFALLQSGTGRPLLDLLPQPETPRPSPTRYTEAGWGGFWEFGIYSLFAFFAAWWMFSWVLRDLDRRPREERMKERLPRAA